MPSTELRQNILTTSRRVVVKIGTQLLTTTEPGIDLDFIESLADQIASLIKRGCEVTLVSSGAVGAGCVELGLPKRPTDVADLQAAAAIGQRRLMRHFYEAFKKHNIPVAQVLLTRTDFDDRNRYLNIRNCIRRLHAFKTLPILNENDTVSVDELRFGDNDMLAALTANALRAQALILLTTVDGLLDSEGNIIDLVDNVSNFLNLTTGENGTAIGKKSSWGAGGMGSKLSAAELVTGAGDIAVIANGRHDDILPRLLAGEKLGTVLLPAKRKLDSRKRWIALTKRPAGTITIDDGAVRALKQNGKSLLASGITHVKGTFKQGDILTIQDSDGNEIARGLTNYPASELKLIQGKRSTEFEAILGQFAYAEVIHRDHLVIS
ncbi:glutamate 5-kinase [Poriferisphaera sp. WC338]|uniref:glutamate 5-kinase n=1 Tax=Poriferisphaera sp. WC338 TaxID=3425129 RepID=UPI003D8154DC